MSDYHGHDHDHDVVERESTSLGMVIGLILAALLALAVLWFAFGANMFGGGMGAPDTRPAPGQAPPIEEPGPQPGGGMQQPGGGPQQPGGGSY